jgi:hypothetical protein
VVAPLRRATKGKKRPQSRIELHVSRHVVVVETLKLPGVVVFLDEGLDHLNAGKRFLHVAAETAELMLDLLKALSNQSSQHQDEDSDHRKGNDGPDCDGGIRGKDDDQDGDGHEASVHDPDH